MSFNIKYKRISGSSAIPALSDFAEGEIIINQDSSKLFVKSSGNVVSCICKVMNNINNVDQYIPLGQFLAKGNIFVGYGASGFSGLSLGTTGQVLIADSSESLGIKWGSAVIVRTKAYFAGGANTWNTSTASIDKYTGSTLSAVTGCTLTANNSIGAGSTAGTSTYLAGGYNQTVNKLNTTTEASCTNVATLATQKMSLWSGALSTAAYFGGGSETGIEKVTASSDSRSSGGTLPFTSKHSCGSQSNSAVYCIGGEYSQTNVAKIISGDTVSSVAASIDVSRIRSGAAYYNNYVYIAGGLSSISLSYMSTSGTEAFGAHSSTLSPVATQCSNVSGTGLSDKALFAGGTLGDNNTYYRNMWSTANSTTVTSLGTILTVARAGCASASA